MRLVFAGSAAFFLVMAGIVAHAVVGIPPNPSSGFGLVDGTWLNGLAGGSNFSYQSAITAAGTTQATATQLPANIYLVEVDTTAASTGVNLPPALPGTSLVLYNNGASTLAIYPTVPNNPITSAQDTVNASGTNTTSTTLATHVRLSCSVAKAGVWACQ
jgi:hypothetical protein